MLLELRAVSTKKKDWGTTACTNFEDVLCLAWQDNNTVQMMTTIHTPDELHQYYLIEEAKRVDIPKNKAVIAKSEDQGLPSGQLGLPVPLPPHEYNLHMGGSDSSAQVRQYYECTIRSNRYWWDLFKFILLGAVTNAYTLYRLANPTSTMTHLQFQHRIALDLLQEPAGNARKRVHPIQISGAKTPEVSTPLHDWVLLGKRQYCQVCRNSKKRPHRRQILGEIDLNRKISRQRGSQTSWGCNPCANSAICHTTDCWNAFHSKK